jgi:holliday junction DNA helicase RuvA
MFESIKGTLVDKTPQKAVVETHGVAYRLAIPLSTYTHLPAFQQAVHLYLSHVVREDSETLYAFLHKEERDLFELLTTISGIGPKTALSIIGHMDLATFQQAVSTSDIRSLSRIPGLGKKTAERLAMEMRDKLRGTKEKPLPLSAGLQGDAMNALLHLGYNPLEAQKAVQAVLSEKKEEKDLAKVISAALQRI